MTVRRRMCRALDCPRHVDAHILFCNVHWPMLTPKLQTPIGNNREAPIHATPDTQRGVINGTANAVSFIARKEGKAAALKRAIASASFAPGQGGAGGAGAGSGSGGTGALDGGGGGGSTGGSTGKVINKY